MTASNLIISKTPHQVRLWVHPEGLVIGSLFLRQDDTEQVAQESAYEVINQDSPFVVLKREQPDEVRFYNRSSIIRVEYTATGQDIDSQATTLHCRLLMMDGSVLEGSINEVLPADQSRLYDYLNKSSVRFIRLFLNARDICLVNKSYIIQVSPLAAEHSE
ncbi:MAG: hypothetical protein R6X06_10790 [Gammaproteobacteria bacterium]